MYWGQRWNESNGSWRGTGTADGDAGKQVLDAVLLESEEPKRSGKPAYIVFPTPAFEQRFKSCLADVPVECHLERDGAKRYVALRPKNVTKFNELVRSSGLANCEPAIRAVRWLQANPSEFIRFETN